MRSVTYALAAALVAVTWQVSTAGAQTPPAQSPQTEVPQAQSPAQTNPAASITDEALNAAATAMLRVASIRRDYIQQLEEASSDEQPRILTEAGNALEQAIADQGLSVEEYNTILELAQNDPQVRQKIIERLQAVEK